MTMTIEPLPWQARALAVPEQIGLVLGGGRGGGKSYLAALLIVRHLAQHGAKARVWVCRPDTMKSASDLADLCETMLVAAYGHGAVSRNRNENTIRVADSGYLEFTSLDASQVAARQGREATMLVCDEAGNFSTLRNLDRLRSGLRSSDGIECRTVILANPGGPCVELARRFVSGRTPWVPFEVTGEPWAYLPSTLQDNDRLDRETYTKRLAASCGNDKALLDSWVSGNWDAISGSFFGDVMSPDLWLPDTASDWIVALRQRPSAFTTHVGIDWGMTSPSVVTFCARAGRGARVGERTFPPDSLIVVDELATTVGDDPHEGAGWSAQMLAEAIVDRCRYWNIAPAGVVDDSYGHTGDTLAETFTEHGVRVERAVKHRADGWRLLRSMMAATRDHNGDEPCLFISERCRYLAATLPGLLRNPLRPEDIVCAPKQADHGADALRMAASHKPQKWAVHAGGMAAARYGTR